MQKIMEMWNNSGLVTKIAIVAIVVILVGGALFGEPSVVEPVK
jgi:hypothetical protein